MHAAYLRSHWAEVRSRLLQTMDRFQPAELDFRPFPSAWTVRELMLHIAHEERGEFQYGLRQTLPEFPAAYVPEDYPDLAAIKALLDQVHAPIADYVAALTDDDLLRVIRTPWGPEYPQIEMLGHLVEHEIHHRAELSLILGMFGREGLDA